MLIKGILPNRAIFIVFYTPKEIKYIYIYTHKYVYYTHTHGILGGTRGKEPACQCRRWNRRGFDPWVGKIPWSRIWQPTPVFLPGESHGQRSLVGYSPWGRKESDMTEMT